MRLSRLASVVAVALIASAARGQSATSTALVVTSGGSSVTTVASPAVITLTATVATSSTPVTRGLVKFCDASATYCTDIHILGAAQLTSAGAATFRFVPGIGSHSYKAVFVGTNTYATSASTASSLTVTGLYPTVAEILFNGNAGNYSLTAELGTAGIIAPTGTVSFLDTTNGNAVLGTVPLQGTFGFGPQNITNPAPTVRTTYLAAADFNGDGLPDLAAVDVIDNSVTVLLGNGNGTFTPVAPASVTGSSPLSAAVGDFNSDGLPDLVIANSGSNSLTVLLGKGDGTFTPSIVGLPTITGPSTVVVADFNRDGIPDLAVSSYENNTVIILLGNGDGTFVQTVLPFSVPNNPLYGNAPIVTADFNGDGNADLAVSYNNVVYIFLGNGDGTFTQSPNTLSVSDPGGHLAVMSAADFNGDGKSDLAIAAIQSPALNIFLSIGNGNFTTLPPANVLLASGGFLAVGDFNGDGKPDLLATELLANSNLLTGNGDGTFKVTIINLSNINTMNSAAIADFNGDGLSDIAVAANGSPIGTVTGMMMALAQTAGVSINIGSIPGTGTHQVVASYSGDSINSSSVSEAVGLTALGAASLTLAASPTTSTYGQQVTLTAILTPFTAQGVSSNGESISFLDNSVSIGTGPLSSGIATMTLSSLPPGADNLSATYAGDANLAPSKSNTLSYTVAKITPAITWTPPINTSVYTGTAIGTSLFNAIGTTPGSINYTATPSGGFPIPLLAGTILSAGTYTLTATLTPTDRTDYATVSATAPFAVTPAPLTVVPVNATRTYGIANPTLAGSVTGALNGDTFTVTSSAPATPTSPVGSYPITYTVAGADIANYSVIPATGTLTITQATPVITWITTTNIAYGTALSASVLNATASAPGAFVYTPASGTVLQAGLQTLSVAFTPTDTTDYLTPPPAIILIQVNKAPLAIAANNNARVFGAANPAFSGTISGAVNGDTFTESFSTTAIPVTIVGNYPITPAVSGTNLADYAVLAAPGTLTITQAGTATTFALSNSNLNLTATVLSLTSGTPTGTVGFYEGQTLVGTGTLSSGTASYTATTFPAGNVVVSAQYSGDVNFTQSASPPIFVVAITPAQASITAPTAGTASDALTITAAAGFAGTLQLSCTGLPQNAICSFQPASVTFPVAVGNSASTTVTIQTGASAAAAPPPPSRHNLAALAELFWLPALLLAAVARRSRKLHPRAHLLTLALLLAAVCTSLTACGSHPAPPTTPAGTSIVHLVATGPSGFSQNTTLTLTVQ
jgi:hypothetical protein